MKKWATWLRANGFAELFNPLTKKKKPDYYKLDWKPTPEDKSAAWQLYTEIRTRITTQPLAFLHGDEETALTSVYNIFQLTRDAIKKHEGCSHFSNLSVYVLNHHIRKFTAKWHREKEKGRLSSADVCHQFRRELLKLQKTLQDYMKLLGLMADPNHFMLESDATLKADSAFNGESIPFGIKNGVYKIDHAEEIDAKEKEEVAARRKFYKIKDKNQDQDAVGLALSGGGIRSATFGLGVVQYLARKGILKQVDFVSTVSGGGYLGSFISSFLNDPKANVTLDPNADDPRPFGQEGEVESRAVRYLRNHSKYITEGGWLTKLRFLAIMLYGLIINTILIMPVILGTVIFADFFLKDSFLDASQGTYLLSFNGVTKGVALVLIVLAIFLPFVQNFGRNAGKKSALKKAQLYYERSCVLLFGFVSLLFFIDLLPFIFQLYREKVTANMELHKLMKLWAGFSSLPAIMVVINFLKTRPGLVKKILMILLAVSGPFFFLATFLIFVDIFIVQDGPLVCGLSRFSVLLGLFTILTIYGAWVLNINFTSLHRFYRQSLSRTYLRRSKGHGEKTEQVDDQLLSEMLEHHEGQTKAPYHLINCALNIPGSDNPDLRGRNTDFFLFSKHFCGSPLVKYHPTKEWEDFDGHLNLGTAFAISAAAAAPTMGTKTNTSVSYLLALLNIRLNYWAARPDGCWLPRWVTRYLGAPGVAYFIKELTGLGMHEKNRYLNLSDGGHIENLGIYELLRRRCKFIIAVDGEADPNRVFEGLLTLVRLAEIDMNIKIRPVLTDLRNNETGFNNAHFLLTKIDYGHNHVGYLLYIKSSMTGDETELILKYRSEHPAFPHESTSDQLFDESQFEAYRALGEHIAKNLFREEIVTPLEPNKDDLTILEWFEALAGNLLERKSASEAKHQNPDT